MHASSGHGWNERLIEHTAKLALPREAGQQERAWACFTRNGRHPQWESAARECIAVRYREWMGELAHVESGHFACIPVYTALRRSQEVAHEEVEWRTWKVVTLLVSQDMST